MYTFLAIYGVLDLPRGVRPIVGKKSPAQFPSFLIVCDLYYRQQKRKLSFLESRGLSFRQLVELHCHGMNVNMTRVKYFVCSSLLALSVKSAYAFARRMEWTLS